GLRDAVADPGELHERVVDALGIDLDADGFLFTAAAPEQLATDSGGTPTWRIKVGVQLGGKLFDTVQLDVSPRQYELERADRIELPNLLEFAGVPAPVVEVVDVHRHAAEKFHAMLRDYGDRENSRVRDLVDLVVMIEHKLVDPATVASCVIDVFAERDKVRPPAALPPLPEG
ncbi:MAG: nucleotidyl transferase AbiEii/AbiGii toxin family protein, partial [Pseudonocardia sp.]